MRILTKIACALAAQTALALAPAHAQITELEEIVITPNRTPGDKAKTGSKVETVTREDIENSSLILVTDYLGTLPGVAVTSPGGVGAEGSLAIRGAPRRYVKTLYNGIDISDPTSTQVQTSYQYVLAGNVDNIEVLKGSQSTLYGSDAIAGVIGISTIGEIEPGVRHVIGAEVGSFGTVRGTYGLRAASDKARFGFNLTGFRTDGISAAVVGTERDGYDNVTADINGEYRFNENVSVFASALYIDAGAEFDDAFANPPKDDPLLSNINLTRQLGARAGFNLDLMDGRLKNTFSVQGFSLDRRIESASMFGPYNADYAGDRAKVDYVGSFEAIDWLTLQYGVDHEQQRAAFSDDAGSIPFAGTASTTGFWGQANLQPAEDLSLSIGLRHEEHSQFGGATTWRSSANYLLPQTDTRLHASVGTGFRAPSLYELFAPPLFAGGRPLGNPDLQPETSVSFDAGVEQRFLEGRLVADVTYFQLAIDNLIQCVETIPFECAYVQVPGTTDMRGVEMSLSHAATSWLDLGGAYTYTHSVTEGGDRNALIPRHTVALSAVARPAEKWTLSANARIAVDTMDTSGSQLDDYVLLNAKLAYKPTEATEIYLRGENLLDQKYELVKGFGAPGTAIYAGFKATF